MRNEIFSDTQLEKELKKFSIKFKRISEEYDEPLKQLLIKGQIIGLNRK